MAERTPTPKVKGNLRPPVEEREDRGREVPAPPVQWYERASPRNTGYGSWTSDPDYDQLPEIVDRWKRGGGPERGFVYAKGGSAKYGTDYRKRSK